jgi:hypothetical protein
VVEMFGRDHQIEADFAESYKVEAEAVTYASIGDAGLNATRLMCV